MSKRIGLLASAGSPAEALWRFSLAFYAEPGVAEALIGLQERCGRDPNLALFALWYGVSGRGRLDTAALAAADAAVAAIRGEIVLPLRELRRRMKPNPAADVQKLRNRIKELEIDAERIVQARLAATAPAPATAAALGVRRDAALANLRLYLGPEPETNLISDTFEHFVGSF